MEGAIHSRRSEYQPIAQFDHTHQTTGIREENVEQTTYVEVVVGSSSEPAAGCTLTDPPAYGAVVKGGASLRLFPDPDADVFRP